MTGGRGDGRAGGAPGPATSDVSEVMGELARSLHERHGDVEATLQAISRAAVRSVPGAQACGMSYVRARRIVEPRAWTSDLVRELDQLQSRLREGPCLDALWRETVVRVDDLTAEPRWPRFTAAAVERGVRSMLAFQLLIEGDALGALNLYAGTGYAFTSESEAVGLVFASHAAVAVAGAQREEHLRAAIDHRDLIGQAKGILMERHRLTAKQAFGVLVEASSRTNRKLLDIAEELTATGAMPPGSTRRH